MPVSIDVEPLLTDDFVEKIAAGVRAAIISVLVQVTDALTLPADEREVLERYRATKAAQRRAAKQLVADAAKAAESAGNAQS